MNIKQNLEWVEKVTVNLLASRLDRILGTEVFDNCILVIGTKNGRKRFYRVNNAGKVTRIYERFVGRAVRNTVYVK